MKWKPSLIGLVVGLVSQDAVAQCVVLEDREGIATPHWVRNGGTVLIEPAFEDYSYMLWDACEAWGEELNVRCAILPMMGDIGLNAVATRCDGNDVIIYDRVLSNSLGYEGAQAVVAHELGHHVCGHLGSTLLMRADPHREEIEADTFAGATLRRLGFGLETVFSYEGVLGDHGSASHPARAVRLAALARGWNDPEVALACIIGDEPSPGS